MPNPRGRPNIIAPKIVALHYKEPDLSARQIATALGTDNNYVLVVARLHKLVLPRSERRKPHLSPQDLQRVVDAYKAGEKLKTIAARFNICPTRVSQHARAAGCPPRPASGPRGSRMEGGTDV